jgi:hypothetical protein
LKCVDTVAANGDHWEDFSTNTILNELVEIISCDLHATAGGQLSCLEIRPANGPGGFVEASTSTVLIPFTTFLLVAGGSTS